MHTHRPQHSTHIPIKLKAVVLAFLSIIIAVFAFTSQVNADTSVWVATQGENKVYVAGTVHLLRKSDFPLPDEYEQAYADSDTLYFETDISGLTSLSVQTKMLQKLTYSDDRTLKTVLNAEAYSMLTQYTDAIGLPLQMLEKFKPGLLVSTLQIFEFQKMGFTPEGVDSYFNTRATGDGKGIGQLETIDEQIDFLASMGEGLESEFIISSLEEMEGMEESMELLISAWRSGDMELLAQLFVDDMKNEYPQLYEMLLVQRNNKWLAIIERMFSEEGTELVLVGTAHLVGEQGLLNQLKLKGYEVTQL